MQAALRRLEDWKKSLQQTDDTTESFEGSALLKAPKSGESNGVEGQFLPDLDHQKGISREEIDVMLDAAKTQVGQRNEDHPSSV